MLVGFFIFTLGLCIGSFLNAFLWRYETKKSLSGRSSCPRCNKGIAWYDNIPLLSYILLWGKCRKCHKAISIGYPIIEFLTGVTFLAVGIKIGLVKYFNDLLVGNIIFNLDTSFYINLFSFLSLFIIASFLIIIAVYDLKKKEIPNGFNLGFIISSLFYAVLLALTSSNFSVTFGYSLLSAFLAFLFFYTFVFISRETWMGGGDAKFALGMGLLLGPAGTFAAIFIASIVGSIYGLSIIFLNKGNSKKKIGLASEIPFAPFLVLGTIISFLFGSQLVAWYAKIFLGL